ncbi:MAG: N(4)-(beta-N-acetylglucosaminyl)-L-asparaginase [Bacteroidia bacterium]|nr:N(4)-(beta-N-acetylglucosaminyl)-L-asparaginase [Bacteroidia bacterium]MCZ2276360.1 N(4)-(beta-N-acetylglucosaminyl)-L-asparaginase [Bacteroidia bacterium]
MIDRKKFLLSTLGLAGLPFIAKSTILKKLTFINKPENFPVVIATWDNQRAVETATKELIAGKTALDAVEAGARVPESDPDDTSVGYGGMPDRDGNVTLDASIMDHLGNAGSVTFLQHIKHPVSVARLVMEKTPHVMLSGEGALRFALEHGFKKENLLTDKAKERWKKWKEEQHYNPVNSNNHDTIGILAIDKQGNVAGACSTSGLAFKMNGRVGDSPIIGAGMYVDNEVGGACATGVGEYVMKTLGSFLIVELMRYGLSPLDACKHAIQRIVEKIPEARNNQVGYLALNKKGEFGAFSIRPVFPYTVYQHGENKKFESESELK